MLRFDEKGGKSREIPVLHDLETFILEYRNAAAVAGEPKDSSFFRSAVRRTKTLSKNRMTTIDMYRMMKRLLKDSGLPLGLSPAPSA
jgi:integrase/recombinase XerD